MQIASKFAFNRFADFVIVARLYIYFFARTRMSLRDFSLPVGDNRWLVKDLFKLMLLLNDACRCFMRFFLRFSVFGL